MENVVDNVTKNAFYNLIEMEQEDRNIKLLFVNGIKGQHDNAPGYYSFDLLEGLDANNYKTIMP